MKDSRSIASYLKKIEDKTYVHIDFLDKLKPNTFDLTKNGRIQSTVFGAFSNIITKINVLNTATNHMNNIEYPLHPDRLGIIISKILKGRLNDFTKQNAEMPKLNGFVHKSIYTSQVKGTKFECAIFNLYYLEQDDSFVIAITLGLGDLVKDETNRNDFSNFEKTNYIGIKIPYNEMELMCYQIDEFLKIYKLTMCPAMLNGRTSYETKCKTIYKDCKGDAKKIKEITEQFNKLSELEQNDILAGKKQL